MLFLGKSVCCCSGILLLGFYIYKLTTINSLIKLGNVSSVSLLIIIIDIISSLTMHYQGNAAIHILRSAFGVAWSDRIRIIFAGDDLTDEDAMKALKVMNVKRMDARVIITRVMIIKIVFARRVIARLLIVQMMFAQTMMAANKREKEKGKVPQGMAYSFRVVNSGLVTTLANHRLSDTKGVGNTFLSSKLLREKKTFFSSDIQWIHNVRYSPCFNGLKLSCSTGEVNIS